MNFKKLEIDHSYLINFNVHEDNRGLFFRNYCIKQFRKKKIVFNCLQANLSLNKRKFTLRGFHYQKVPFSEPKFFFPVNGKFYNISIDLRKKSKTFLKKQVLTLDSKKRQGIYLPPGCANAFITLEQNTIVQYFMGNYYSSKHYKGFRYDDTFFNIKWPYKPKVISEKDLKYNPFNLKNL